MMARQASLVVLLGLAWGVNWPAARLSLNELTPFTFRAFGFAAGASVLFGLIYLRGLSPAIPRPHWWRLVLVGSLSVLGYNIFSSFSLLTASTSRSAVLSYMMPVWAVLLAWPVLGERLDRRRIVGLALGGAGLVALGLPLIRSGTFSIGLVYALASGIVWAIGSVTLKRFPIEASPLVISAWQLLFAAFAATGFMLAVDGFPRSWPTMPSTWLGLGYNILIGQAFATTLWFTILGSMPAGIASIGTLLVPGVGVISAMLVLGERPTATDWLGLVLIVAASASVLLRWPPRGATATPS